MISKFVREQKRYTQKELSEILECSETESVNLIRRLKEYGVLKAVKLSETQRNMSDLIEDDIEIADVDVDDNEYLYVFTFVGIITISGRVLKCYPKYFLKNDSPLSHLCQVIKVIEKFNAKEQIIRIFNDRDNESNSFNLLAVLMFIIQDYYDNGVYNTTEEIVEKNGNGEILWDKTINESFALIMNNRPYYIDMLTKKRQDDDYDYFKRLHECVLTKAFKELREAGLLEIFEVTEAVLSDEIIDDFGEKEYILYRIEGELNTQFITRKQLLLKTMYAYISNGGTLNDIESFSMFGTNSFHVIWEKVCSDILDNQLETPIGQMKLPVQLRSGYNSSAKLVELIEKPLWTETGITANDTFIPDTITIINGDKKSIFLIFDAKYYNARLEKGLAPKGQPGIESVAKQYLYQLAYKQFIKDHGFSETRNCFLLPTEEDNVIAKGSVNMEMFSNLGLEDIQVRLLPASMAFDCYLSGTNLNPKLLEL